VEIAKAGGLRGRIPLSTARLGEITSASQQTASRKLAYLEDQGYIKRFDINGNKVQEITLTEKAIIELRNLHGELSLIFAGPSEIVMRGRAISGIGEGRYYVTKYADYFRKNLGIEPWPGTLNVKLLDDRDVVLRSQVEIQGGIIMRGFTEEERSFGDVFAYAVKISKDNGNGKESLAYFLKIERTHYDKSVVELISSMKLRDVLDIKDGDVVRIVFLPKNRK